ncbi:MAG: DUF2061 domain-containing protein [Bacteroidota bacterium]
MAEIARESRLRSVLKALSRRVIATTTIIAIAYFTTNNIEDALKIGAIEFFIKFALYNLHERAWQMAPRGTIRKMFGNKTS